MYLYSGDISILREHYGNMVAWLAYIRKVDGDDHGWRKIFHYGDWLALDSPCKGVSQTRGGTDEGFIADVYYRKSALITAKVAKLLGYDEDAEYYNSLAEKILRGIREEYFSVTGRCCIPTQTAAILTWKENLSDRERAKNVLKEMLENNRNMLTTGFVGTPFLCETLVEQGLVDEAFKLLLNEEYPGWLYAVNLGATTIWERWNSLDETGHISSTGMNSLNHYTYGSIVGWIWKDVAGLRVMEETPGFRMVRIAPRVNWKLKFLEARYPSPAGTYEISWQIEDIEHLAVRIVVPAGCKAIIELPLSGREAFKVDAGAHEFRYQTVKELARIYSTGDKLKILMAEVDVRRVLQEEINDVEYLASYTGEYPLRETLTNLNYSLEFIDGLDEKLKSVY
jgi:alpha-L-rhamnosidase